MRFVFQFTFHAVILWSFIWAFTRQATQFGFPVDKIDRVVSVMVVVMGIVDAMLLLWNFFDDDMRESMMVMAFQERWTAFWVVPFTLFHRDATSLDQWFPQEQDFQDCSGTLAFGIAEYGNADYFDHVLPPQLYAGDVVITLCRIKMIKTL